MTNINNLKINKQKIYFSSKFNAIFVWIWGKFLLKYDFFFFNFGRWNYMVISDAKSLQLCLTLCDPMDYSLPDSFVHGILQARILKWAAMPSSGGSSLSRGWTHIFYVYTHWLVDSLPLVPPGKPIWLYRVINLCDSFLS